MLNITKCIDHQWGANGRKIVGQLKMKMFCFITGILIPKGKKKKNNGVGGGSQSAVHIMMVFYPQTGSLVTWHLGKNTVGKGLEEGKDVQKKGEFERINEKVKHLIQITGF